MVDYAAGKAAGLFTLDANTPLSAGEHAMLVRLAAMPDSDIDYSDIPPGTK